MTTFLSKKQQSFVWFYDPFRTERLLYLHTASFKIKQESQFTFNATQKRVRLVTFAAVKQNTLHILSMCY